MYYLRFPGVFPAIDPSPCDLKKGLGLGLPFSEDEINITGSQSQTLNWAKNCSIVLDAVACGVHILEMNQNHKYLLLS